MILFFVSNDHMETSRRLMLSDYNQSKN